MAGEGVSPPFLVFRTTGTKLLKCFIPLCVLLHGKRGY
ncbi:hypothetical protein P74p73 [Thermus phage P74-26]|uniref:Uncharacterized protein n=1 Tax=Thermus phage P74-26 TaxID=2914007 RepID=A7XXP9_BP742|nr:hypothetical protein P74p73 [Thermus phage P74-26]ABU97023.1 hypothetical protein P74p73 [Thermus phage P74-26]